MPRPRKNSYDGDKPPFSYVALCAMAIHSSNSKMMTLSQIYRFITDNFPFYRENSKRWQNSLRHNLSFNDCFVKVSKSSAHGGKGNYWTLHDSCAEMFHDGSFLRRKRRFHSDDEEMRHYKRTDSGDTSNTELDHVSRNKASTKCTPFTIDNILKNGRDVENHKEVVSTYQLFQQKVDPCSISSPLHHCVEAMPLHNRSTSRSTIQYEPYGRYSNYISYRTENRSVRCSCRGSCESVSRYQSCNRHFRQVKMIHR